MECKDCNCGENFIKIDTTYGHPRFFTAIKKMAEIHANKNRDYGNGNPLGNFMTAEQLGVDPFLGVLIRMSDKWTRICSLTNSGEQYVKDEAIEDTLMDLANYALLSLVIKEEVKYTHGGAFKDDERIDISHEYEEKFEKAKLLAEIATLDLIDSAVQYDPENYGNKLEFQEIKPERCLPSRLIQPMSKKTNPCKDCEWKRDGFCAYASDCVALEVDEACNRLNNDQYIMNLKSFTCLTCTMFAGDPDHEAHNCYHCIFNGKKRPGSIDYYVDQRAVAALAGKGIAGTLAKDEIHCVGGQFCACVACVNERIKS